MAVAAVSFLLSRGVAVAEPRSDRSHVMARRPILASQGITAARPRQLEAQASAIPVGQSQRVVIDTSGGELSPDYINVEAGVPVEVRFESSDGCAERIVFEGVESVSGGDGRVLLPPMEPGIHAISCGGGEPDGLLVVR